MKGAQWFVASTLVLMGAYLLVFGKVWSPSLFKLLSGSTLGTWMELIVPLLPMVLIGAGAALIPFHRR